MWNLINLKRFKHTLYSHKGQLCKVLTIATERCKVGISQPIGLPPGVQESFGWGFYPEQTSGLLHTWESQRFEYTLDKITITYNQPVCTPQRSIILENIFSVTFIKPIRNRTYLNCCMRYVVYRTATL